MKRLLPSLAILFTITLHAQITSGTVTYQLNWRNTGSDNFDTTEKGYPENKITVEFNEHYIRTENHEWDSKASWNLENKTDGTNIVFFMNDEEKYVRFVEKVLPKKSEKENTKSTPNTYQEDFYKDLMKLKLNDTIVEKTDETKEIAGFLCKKTVLKIAGNQTITVWSTNKITGLESLYKMESLISGTILSYTNANEKFTVFIEAIEVTKTNNLDEKDLLRVPPGYSLNLGSFYQSSYHKGEGTPDEFLEIPSFITFPSSSEAITKITDEVDQSFQFNLEKDPYPYIYIQITVSFDEKGAIASVKFLDDIEESNNSLVYDKKKLESVIKKNCALKAPVLIDGKAVPALLEIQYSYSGNQR